MRKFFLRLDDACHTMHILNWNRIETILDKYSIKPLVGVIPDCMDQDLKYSDWDITFFEKVRKWRSKNWDIAMHGVNHLYKSHAEWGINPILLRSEFSGLAYEEQQKLIDEGYKILINNGIEPSFFFAPSHNFDKNTLMALYKSTNIRKISDTFSFRPYIKYQFQFYPVHFGHLINVKLTGLWTFCLHPNTMKDVDFFLLEDFLSKHHRSFSRLSEIEKYANRKINIFEKILQKIYYLRRYILVKYGKK